MTTSSSTWLVVIVQSQDPAAVKLNGPVADELQVFKPRSSKELQEGLMGMLSS